MATLHIFLCFFCAWHTALAAHFGEPYANYALLSGNNIHESIPQTPEQFDAFVKKTSSKKTLTLQQTISLWEKKLQSTLEKIFTKDKALWSQKFLPKNIRSSLQTLIPEKQDHMGVLADSLYLDYMAYVFSMTHLALHNKKDQSVLLDAYNTSSNPSNYPLATTKERLAEQGYPEAFYQLSLSSLKLIFSSQEKYCVGMLEALIHLSQGCFQQIFPKHLELSFQHRALVRRGQEPQDLKTGLPFESEGLSSVVVNNKMIRFIVNLDRTLRFHTHVKNLENSPIQTLAAAALSFIRSYAGNDDLFKTAIIIAYSSLFEGTGSVQLASTHSGDVSVPLPHGYVFTIGTVSPFFENHYHLYKGLSVDPITQWLFNLSELSKDHPTLTTIESTGPTMPPPSDPDDSVIWNQDVETPKRMTLISGLDIWKSHQAATIRRQFAQWLSRVVTPHGLITSKDALAMTAVDAKKSAI